MVWDIKYEDCLIIHIFLIVDVKKSLSSELEIQEAVFYNAQKFLLESAFGKNAVPEQLLAAV